MLLKATQEKEKEASCIKINTLKNSAVCNQQFAHLTFENKFLGVGLFLCTPPMANCIGFIQTDSGRIDVFWGLLNSSMALLLVWV